MGLRRVRIKVTVFLEFWGRGSPEILHIQFVGKRFRSTELVKGVTLVCAQFSALGACERFGESEREKLMNVPFSPLTPLGIQRH